MIDLKAVEARHKERMVFYPDGPLTRQLFQEDIPALVAEVRRLETELAALKAAEPQEGSWAWALKMMKGDLLVTRPDRVEPIMLWESSDRELIVVEYKAMVRAGLRTSDFEATDWQIVEESK